MELGECVYCLWNVGSVSTVDKWNMECTSLCKWNVGSVANASTT